MKTFNWVDNNNTLNVATAKQIEDMTVTQYLAVLDGRMVDVARNRRYDTLVFPTNTLHKAGTSQTIFRRGVEEADLYFGTNNAYNKTRVHTNMLKGGEFDAGDLVILKGLEVELPLFGGKPTTQAAGVVSNAKATFPATFDPGMAAYRLLNQLWIEFIQGTRTIFQNKAIYFTQSAGVAVAYGANAGAVAQNGNGGENLMPNPRVIEGSRDFSVRVTLLSDFDATNANGIDQEISLSICFPTTELLEKS